jgi:hypothetical protein
MEHGHTGAARRFDTVIFGALLPRARGARARRRCRTLRRQAADPRR